VGRQISGAVFTLRTLRYPMASQWMVDVDGVYTRSYDVSVAATLSFSAFCEITVESEHRSHRSRTDC
jgi:hypothetical protein